MTFHFAPAFDRSLRRLSLNRKRRAHQAAQRIIDLFETGQLPVGMGLKRLRGSLWESRAGLSDRIILKLESGSVTFRIVGTHDEVRRYLKNAS